MRWLGGTDLAHWADRRDSQERMPELIRRLVHATVSQLERIEFRAGEGVQLAGWDGIVQTPQGNAYVPSGLSCWEVGTGASPKGKADADYEKRAADPLGLDPQQTTFVFVTPRRWAGKNEWVNEKRSQQHWADVRAYDGDDLEGWLEQAPAVGAWLARAIGKYPRGVQSLEDFWAEFSLSTNPALPSDVLLAGRDDAVQRLHGWLQSGTGSLRVRADTTNEALAFTAAAVAQLTPEECAHHLSRIIIVKDLETAREVITTRHALTICWNLSATEPVGITVQSGHHVLLPEDRTVEPLPKEHIDLPRLAEESLVRALCGAGLREEHARNLVRGTGRRLQPLRRRLARTPSFAQPEWAQRDHGTNLVPILLAGSWHEREESDREVLATLAGRSYAEVENSARRWSIGGDVPLKYVSGIWRLVSPLDAWHLLAGYIRPPDLERFRAVAVEVLAADSGRLGLAPDQRWISTTKVFPHSHRLRDGLAQTMVLLGALGEQGVVSNRAQDISRQIVAILLDGSADWRRWYSLSGLLPLLAEAAPDEFLAGLEDFLSRDPASTRHLFEEEDPFGGGSAHTHILWALECLAWFPQYLGQVTVLLGTLARLDPGGRTANRPIASLREVFLLWHPNTGATLEQRFQALDLLVRREPAVAWELFISLLPRLHDVGMPTHSPQWRQHAVSSTVTFGEHYRGIKGVIDHALRVAGNDGARIATLIKECASWPPDLRSVLVAHIQSFCASNAEAPERSKVWEALREVVNQHRTFADAAWALHEAELAKLADLLPLVEPPDAVQRSLWLFQDWFPDLPNLKSDLREREKEIERHRREAVEAVLEESGTPGLYELARRSKFPRFVGGSASAVITSTPHEHEILRATLGSSEGSLRELGMGFVFDRHRSEGEAWVDRTLPLLSDDDRTVTNFFLALPASRTLWNRVFDTGRQVERLYWAQTRLFLGEHDDLCEIEFAIEHLLAVDNVLVAVDLASANAARLTGAELVRILDALVGALADSRVSLSQHVAFAVSETLGALASKSDVTEEVIARLEWTFLPLLHHGRLAGSLVLHRRLAREPAFFAEVIALVFRPSHREDESAQQLPEPSEDQKARARLGYDLLSSWKVVPGTRSDGSVDQVALENWVRDARARCHGSGHADVGDVHIGEVLAYAPTGSDGIWPHESVRSLLERGESRALEDGFRVGTYNKRGVVTKSVGEGGTQERTLAAEYRGFAEALAIRWPRTAAVLRAIAVQYEREGHQEDERSSQEE